LEFSEQMGLPVDLSSASRAATQCALREDKLIFTAMMNWDTKAC